MFSWTFSNTKTRSPAWYIVALIFVGVLTVFGIVSGIYLLSIVVVLFAGVFLLIENNATPTSNISIDENFIQIDGRYHQWRDFSSFALLTVNNIMYLELFFVKKFSPPIQIPVNTENININDLYNFLVNILPENENITSNFNTLAHMTQI